MGGSLHNSCHETRLVSQATRYRVWVLVKTITLI